MFHVSKHCIEMCRQPSQVKGVKLKFYSLIDVMFSLSSTQKALTQCFLAYFQEAKNRYGKESCSELRNMPTHSLFIIYHMSLIFLYRNGVVLIGSFSDQ